MFEVLLAHWGLWASSFGVGLVSGFVPFVNAEVYLVGVTALVGGLALVQVVLLTTLGQMLAKSVMYLAGRGVLRLAPARYQSRLGAAHRRLERWKYPVSLFLFLSASVSLPPFYVVSILAGALRVPFPSFFVLGLAGRCARFSVVVAISELAQRVIE